jgi:Transposase, Mutator family
MQRWGTHPSGSIRWRCKDCGTNGVRRRKDNRQKRRLSLFVRWLTSKKSLVEVAAETKVSVQSLTKWFAPLWNTPPQPNIPSSARVLVLDATSIAKRVCMLLIAGDADTARPVSWLDVPRECYDAWWVFLKDLSNHGVTPGYVVCDGQRGLLKAIREVWPRVKIQRCLIHVVRQASNWLTRNPRTRAGRELLVLVKQLSFIQTKRQKRRWTRAFRSWCKRHDMFLKERSYGPRGRWWYTHRKLRGTRSLLKNAIPDLFRFITDPSVPKTSNHVEGGLNARLKELIRCHRGFSLRHKLILAAWYLALRQGQKPTRKFN